MKKLSEFVTKNKTQIGVLLLCFIVLIVACIYYVNNSRQTAIINTPKEKVLKAQLNTAPEGYTAITTKEQLATIKDNLSGKYILMADLDMTDVAYEIIGQTSSAPFKGTFDGNYHKISNLKIESGNQYVGMFGYIDNGTVENLTLENINVKGTNRYIGGLAGSSFKGTITNVGVTGEITSTSNYVGGLIGYWSSTRMGTITNSYSTAKVTGVSYVGGLVGQSYGIITNAYSTGEVTGTSYVGGIVGENAGDIRNTYSTAKVTGTSYVGGLVGRIGVISNVSGTVANSYWALDINNQKTSDGGEGKIFSAMLRQNTYKNWDFETVWQIEEGATLPYLRGMTKPEAVKKENYDYIEWEGEGTESNPYLVKTAKHLNAVNNLLTVHYKLANDIDMTDVTYEVIGQTTSKPFAGTFDGNNHKISNLKIESANQYVGMFGYVRGGTIKNLLLESVNIKGTSTYVGGLAGYNYNGTITNVGVTGEVTSTNNYVGGLLGYNGGTVTNAYSTVAVSGNNNVGGLIGEARGTITNTYAVGKVMATGTSKVGGLVGYKSGTVNNSYWAVDTTGQATSPAGEGKFFSAMLKQGSYTNWDFNTVWEIEEGVTLPYLKGMAKPTGVNKTSYTYTEWEGAGTQESPYLVKTPEQLNAINYSLSTHYKLTNDINMQDKTFEIIAKTQSTAFTGTFDGDGHKISNLKIESANQYIGMFGYINGGKIKNLLLENVQVKGTNAYVGGLAGGNYNGTITNVGVTGEVTSTGNSVGGLLGYNSGTITNAYSTVAVSGGASNIGGLIGQNYNGTITNTYAVGKVTATGASSVGGLTGYNRGTVTNSYWAVDITTQTVSSGGEGKFLSAMLKQATFKNWDFNTVWQIEEGTTLPYLKGMAKPEDIKAQNYTYTEWEGAGTEESPYLVKTPEQLNAINYSLSTHYKLANDIDMTDEVYEVIGATTTRPFTGTFDGNNHKISNLKIESENQYVGMFGYISGGTIKNLLLENVNITGTSTHIGGLAGSNYNGTITNVGVTGEVTGTSNYVGGLLGYNSGTITNAYSTVAVSGGTSYVGGLVGQSTGTITNTYAVGKVTATGTSYVGGLTGYKAGTVNNSYWAIDVSGQSTSSSGEGKLFSALLKQATFKNWNFETVWEIEEGNTLPYLIGTTKPEAVKKENYTYMDIDGSGTEENPYLIKTAEQLNSINNLLSGNYKLANDIDMTGKAFEIIAKTQSTAFTGTFDGDGHKITNLTIESDDANVGMFGYINAGKIKNLVLENVNIKSTGNNYDTYLGGLVGYNYNGTIENIVVKGNIINNNSIINNLNIGGIIGYSINGRLNYLTNEATIINSKNTDLKASNVGGIVGNFNGNSTNITKSVNNGEIIVKGKMANVGGIVGNSGEKTGIQTSYSTGKISVDLLSTAYVGGIAGKQYYSFVSNSYSTTQISGKIEQNGYVGGLIGNTSGYKSGNAIYASSVRDSYAIGKIDVQGENLTLGGLIANTSYYSIANSYWSQELTGIETSATTYEKPLLTQRMFKQESYNNWNFGTILGIKENRLRYR